jgi:Protein of unknown function (DUF2934)
MKTAALVLSPSLATGTRSIVTRHEQDVAMTIFDIAATLTGEPTMTKYTGGRDRPLRNEIAERAYHFYETRGRQDGHDVDDWLSAERELTHHYR